MKNRPLIIDSNFFINGFKDNPNILDHFRNICESHGYSIYTSLRVFQELNWRLKKQLKHKIKVIDVDNKQIDNFIKSNQVKFDFLPQKPDLSLLLLTEKLGDSLVVSSDFKLIETANSVYDGGLIGVMGSAFLLKMIEEEIDDENKELLIKIRDKIQNEEIRYSIQRQKFFDPITRIKLIERQSIDIIKNIKMPQNIIEYNWSTPDVNPILNTVKELRSSYPRYINEIREEKYEVLISELNNIRKEIYDTLLLLNWQIERKEHEYLLKIITPHLIFLNYLAAICHVYVGTKESMYNAFKRLESANGILLIGLIPSNLYRTLMISLHQLRIIVLLLLRKYEDAVLYFSLYERKCDEWGFGKIYEYSKGIYYALINLHGRQIIDEISKNIPIKPALEFLIDISNQLFRLGSFEESRLILNQAFILNMELEDQKYLEAILKQSLLLFYAYDNTDMVIDIAKFLDRARKLYIHKDLDTNLIDNIWDEIKNQKIPLLPPVTNKRISLKALPEPFLDWMPVFKVIKGKKKDKDLSVLCRNWKFQINLSLKFNKDKLNKKINLGDLIQLGDGLFKIGKSNKKIQKKYNVPVQIIPDKDNSKLYIRGGEGCKCIELSDEPIIYLEGIKKQESPKLTTKIKRKLLLKKD
jgi:hypothetical protein